MNGKIYAISDIHGEFFKIKGLIEKLTITEKDTLVFLGDYIDRGLFSFQVVDYLCELNKKYNCVFIKGNHEDMFLDYLSGIEERTYLYNNGQTTLDSYKDNAYDINRCVDYSMRSIPKEHYNFFVNLKYFYETEDYIFVHAGIYPYNDLKNQLKDTLIWDRDFYFGYSNMYRGPKTIIYGHTPGPIIKKNDFAICIDTGACFKGEGYGYLTCLELPAEKIYRQGDDA